jgi:predicted RNase H-like HicB family nuclease
MRFAVEVEREEDGRWIAEFVPMPGVLAYGSSRYRAIATVLGLAASVIAGRLKPREHLRRGL